MWPTGRRSERAENTIMRERERENVNRARCSFIGAALRDSQTKRRRDRENKKKTDWRGGRLEEKINRNVQNAANKSFYYHKHKTEHKTTAPN